MTHLLSISVGFLTGIFAALIAGVAVLFVTILLNMWQRKKATAALERYIERREDMYEHVLGDLQSDLRDEVARRNMN